MVPKCRQGGLVGKAPYVRARAGTARVPTHDVEAPAAQRVEVRARRLERIDAGNARSAGVEEQRPDALCGLAREVADDG